MCVRGGNDLPRGIRIYGEGPWTDRYQTVALSGGANDRGMPETSPLSVMFCVHMRFTFVYRYGNCDPQG